MHADFNAPLSAFNAVLILACGFGFLLETSLVICLTKQSLVSFNSPAASLKPMLNDVLGSHQPENSIPLAKYVKGATISRCTPARPFKMS